jgi:guanylate kinase
MYKYEKVSNWLQLEVTTNDKGQFILTEYDFTGVLILQKTAEGFNGIWISPDTKRQLKVVLKKEKLSDKDKEQYEDKYEKLNYSNYDC